MCEEKLALCESRFESIFEGAQEGIVVADLEGKRFFMANKAFCDLLGYDIEEIKKLGVDDIHPKDDLPYVWEQFKKQASGKIFLAKNMPVKRNNGSIFYADIKSSFIVLDKKQYLVGFFYDISEQKNKISELERMNELMTGRELKMVELKRKIAELEEKVRKLERNRPVK